MAVMLVVVRVLGVVVRVGFGMGPGGMLSVLACEQSVSVSQFVVMRCFMVITGFMSLVGFVVVVCCGLMVLGGVVVMVMLGHGVFSRKVVQNC